MLTRRSSRPLWLAVLGVSLCTLMLALAARDAGAQVPMMTVTSVTPGSLPEGGEGILTIHGAGFPTISNNDCEAGGIINVTVDGMLAPLIEPNTDTQIRVLAPARPAGAAVIVVQSPCDGRSVTVIGALTYVSDEPTIRNGSIPAGGGFGLFIFSGGTNDELVEASGCPSATATFWATDASGNFVLYIPGTSVGTVNDAWNDLFAGGIPADTPLIGRCV